MTKLVNKMKSGQDNECHLSMVLANERKVLDAKTKSLAKCETLLKECSDQCEKIKRENAILAKEVSETASSIARL